MYAVAEGRGRRESVGRGRPRESSAGFSRTGLNGPQSCNAPRVLGVRAMPVSVMKVGPVRMRMHHRLVQVSVRVPG